MTLWWIFILGGLVTYLTRLSFILLWGKVTIPDLLIRALKFVPPAVLSAIILPELLLREGQINLSWSNARLLAGICAILVAWKTKNSLLTIIIGMAVLLTLQVIIPN